MRQLSPRERRYIRNRYGPKRMEQTEAYIEATRRADGTTPNSSVNSAKVSACRMDKRLRSRPALWADIMAAAEIDDYAIVHDLNWARTATKTEFYQGEAIAEVNDNATRVRALELMMELLGRKKPLELTGTLTVRYEADTDAGFVKRTGSDEA